MAKSYYFLVLFSVDWLCSPPLRFKKFKIPDDLNTLLKQWQQELEKAPDLKFKTIYSKATQRIKKIASEGDQNDHSASLEALVIAEFLVKL